jgi:hypothetical protein
MALQQERRAIECISQSVPKYTWFSTEKLTQRKLETRTVRNKSDWRGQRVVNDIELGHTDADRCWNKK